MIIFTILGVRRGFTFIFQILLLSSALLQTRSIPFENVWRQYTNLKRKPLPPVNISLSEITLGQQMHKILQIWCENSQIALTCSYLWKTFGVSHVSIWIRTEIEGLTCWRFSILLGLYMMLNDFHMFSIYLAA